MGAMSSTRACPFCTQINPTAASVCLACGSALSSPPKRILNPSEVVIDVTRLEADEDTVPAVHLDAPELQRWFDSRTDGPDSANAPFDLTLRSLDDFPVLDDVASPADADALPPGVVLRSDGEPAPGAPADKSSATKAARRAAVRRRRLSCNPSPVSTTPLPADVLVLVGDDPACEQLCGLLEVFGFRAHPVQTPAQALRMLDAKHFVAAFLDILFDGPDQQVNADLCQRVKTEVPHTVGRLSALIVVSGSKRPVERVRATLAGSDAFLSKPVTRGSVAQALEACGVVLPTDSRRGARPSSAG